MSSYSDDDDGDGSGVPGRSYCERASPPARAKPKSGDLLTCERYATTVAEMAEQLLCAAEDAGRLPVAIAGLLRAKTALQIALASIDGPAPAKQAPTPAAAESAPAKRARKQRS